MMRMYTYIDLRTMQNWSLQKKIQVTQTRIIEWYKYYNGNVYVSFSGGVDSTVLLDLTRRVYEDIPAVFVDTGLEYPELREFVKTIDNVTWLKPKLSFHEVVKKYGYPVISKEVSNVIYGARKGQDHRLARINGKFLDKYGNPSQFNCEKFRYLMGAPFKISDKCCYHMKIAPIKKYEVKTNRQPVIGTMACESRQRLMTWLEKGCNSFNLDNPTCKPISFWMQQDILQYLKITGIPYASVYGNIVNNQNILSTTGVKRTGCMFCMYGVHLETKPNRFQIMKATHPELYNYCIYKIECGKVLDFIGVPY